MKPNWNWSNNDGVKCETTIVSRVVVVLERKVATGRAYLSGVFPDMDSAKLAYPQLPTGAPWVYEYNEQRVYKMVGLTDDLQYYTNNVQPTQERRSKCPSCGGVKIANPASKYFEARPNEDEDWDWDGCTQGSGT